MNVMPLFVSSDEVISRMQLDPGMTGIVPEVEKAIRRAELYVEAKLDGKLVRRSWDCLFYLDGDAFSGIQPGGLFKLEMPSAFMRSDVAPTVEVSAATTPDQYSLFSGQMDPFAGLSAASSDYYRIDYDRGYLFMSALAFRDRYVRVVCQTGYEPGTNPLPVTGLSAYDAATTYQKGDQVQSGGVAWEAQLDDVLGITPADGNTSWKRATIPIEELPMVLNEAILSVAPLILDAQASKDRAAEDKVKFDLSESFVQELLKPYLRYSGFTFRPLMKR